MFPFIHKNKLELRVRLINRVLLDLRIESGSPWDKPENGSAGRSK